MSRRLLLVGAGHAHLEVVRSFQEERWSDVEVCMISSSRYQYYSGMFSGYTEGLFSVEDTRIDLKKLAEKSGVHFIEKTAIRLRPEQQKVVCKDGSVYPFDVISFDIGSRSLPASMNDTVAKTIKPNDRFIDEIEGLRQSSQPLIVGGGAAGTELALSLQTYKANHKIPGQVRLVTSDRILSQTSTRVSKKLKSLLVSNGIQVWENERVEEVEDNYIKTDRGNKIRHSGVLWLGGALADPIFKNSGIDTDENNFAWVQSTLQFKDYEYIFGAGDCVTMSDHPNLPKSGVYAVKQGPVLWGNLRNFFMNDELSSFNPQKKALYILSTGRKQGFLVYGKLSYHSHGAWKLKNKIDREFMEKYK